MVAVGSVKKRWRIERWLLCMVAISLAAIGIAATTVRAAQGDIGKATTQASPDLSGAPFTDVVTPEGVSPTSGNTSASVVIAASGMIVPLRLIVVDESDRIVEMWSNTASTTAPYSLLLREGSRQGPQHPLTSEIKTQYDRLLTGLDWSEAGQVY